MKRLLDYARVSRSFVDDVRTGAQMSTGGWADQVSVGQIREVWGDLVQPVDPGLLPPGLSEQARDFLTTVGLPTVEVCDMIPVRDEQLRTPVRREGRNYAVVFIGYEPGYRFGVDLETGWVRYVDDFPQADRPVNSTLALFIYLLGRFRRDYLELQKVNRDIATEAVVSIHHELSARDPEAARDDRCWWYPTLDQVEMESE